MSQQPDRPVLIRGATVVTMDPEIGDLAPGDLLLREGRIEDVGPRIDAPPEAEVVEGADLIAIPGFVDTHRHVWQSQARSIAADWTLVQYFIGVLGTLGPRYEPDDVYAATLLGVAETLDAGITTILDWSHIMNSPEHADALVQAHAETGSRAVVGYGEAVTAWLDPSSDFDYSDLRRVKERYFSSDGLVTLALAARGPDFSVREATETAWNAANELDLPISVHVGVGNWNPGGAIDQLRAWGLLRDRTTYIHCSTSTDEELRMIADSGGSASVAPEVEMHMGHGYPPTRRLIEAGVAPTISIDVCTGIGGDMFGQMRSILSMQRALDNQANLEAGEQPERLDITTRDVLGFATIEGARACGLEAKTGSLTPGKEADVVLVSAAKPNMLPVNNPVGAVVLAANTANVDSVFVGGRPLKRGGELVGVDMARIKRLAEESRDALFERAGAKAGGSWLPNPALLGG